MAADPNSPSDPDANTAENPDEQQAGGSQDDKLASLKELRDSGVINEQEYEAKVSALQSESAPSAALPDNVPMRTVEIDDPQLGMRAATMQIPADWKFGGTVIRAGGCHGNGAQVVYSMHSPDGTMGIEVYPSFIWRNSGQPPQPKNLSPRIAAMNPPPRNPCEALEIDSAEGFLEHVVLPTLRPWAKVTNIGPLMEPGQVVLRQRLQVLEQQAEQQAARARQAGFPKGSHPDQHMLDGGIAYASYNLNGHEVDETLSTAVHCSASWMPGSYVSTPSVNVNCNAWPLVVLRAPRGTLPQNLNRLLAIKATYQMDQTWDYVMGQLIQQMGQQMLAASNAQFQTMMQNSQAMAAARTAQHNAFMQQQAGSFATSQAQFYSHQQAMDESAHSTVLYALDQHGFIDSKTGREYDISNQYNHAYLGTDGTLVGSSGPLSVNSTVPGISYSEIPMR